MATIDKHRPQYSTSSIDRYEKIFGRDFVSTGGAATTQTILEGLGLEPGMHVLDVGCGLGGSAFLMARAYGVRVTGIDLLPQMINLAKDRGAGYGLDGVVFSEGDVLEMELSAGAFDLVYSRDAFLHIADKAALFKKLLHAVRPGGKLYLTDYGCGPKPWSVIFAEYQARNGYDLHEPEAYAAVVRDAGFVDVAARDETDTFVATLRRECDAAANAPDTGPDALSPEDRDYLVDRWRKKIQYCDGGDMRWVHVSGTRPA